MAGTAATAPPCNFCQMASSSTSTKLLYQDDKVVAFPDINPAAFRHYLVIPVEHIPTVKDLQRRPEDYSLVSHMLDVGRTLLQKDAPQSSHRFGFHQPPFNSPLFPRSLCRWRHLKYMSLGPVGFIEAEKLLEKLKPS